METGSPRKIQFTVPLLDTHLDPEAAEQVSRKKKEMNDEVSVFLELLVALIHIKLNLL